MKLLFAFILLSSVCFGQSKKDQIEGLNKTIDSLNIVLATTRDNSAKDISSLNDKIKEISDEVTALKSDLTNLQASNNKLSKENEKFKTDLEEMSKKNLELEAKLKTSSMIDFSKLIGEYHSNQTDGSGFEAPMSNITIFEENDLLNITVNLSVYGGVTEAEIVKVYKEGNIYRLILRGLFSNEEISESWDNKFIDLHLLEVKIDKSNPKSILFIGLSKDEYWVSDLTFYKVSL